MSGPSSSAAVLWTLTDRDDQRHRGEATARRAAVGERAGVEGAWELKGLSFSQPMKSRERLRSKNRLADRQEFANLKAHNTIYKLIGPGLVPQDPVEAKANVEKRLQFIKGEM